MKKVLILGVVLGSALLLGSCKSKESAYRQAYEKAQAQQAASTDETTTTVAVQPVTATPTETVRVTPVTTPAEDNTPVRTIDGGVTVVNGEALRAYSVVVGSFVTQANAEGLQATLKSKGYSARVVKTNETINGHTGWFRVVASSFSDKASAVQSKNELAGSYPGAWLLFSK